MALAHNDFLDSKGLQDNFLTHRPYTDAYKAHAAKWAALPMYTDTNVMADLVQSVRDSPVTLVISGTGSGKTVIVPKVAAKILSSMQEDIKFGVAVTNPKSSTTLANAEYAARCMDVELGQEVGYHFRGAPVGSRSAATKLLYLTDGMLLAQVRADKMLHEYSTIIIDEAHERPPPVDFLIQASVGILKARPEFRVVIMSATIDADLFAGYFTRRGVPVRTIYAQGVQSHAVEHVYEHGTHKKYLPAGIRRLREIIIDGDSKLGADILFFVPTSGDAVQGCMAFNKECASEKCASVLCTELYSKASSDAKAAALTPAPDPFIRKVIFATNVAESSFTFPGLGYVVDSGLELSSAWDALRRCQVLSKRFTTQAQIVQREGRVGRQGPGKVYHLYSEKHRKDLRKYPDPHILGMDLTQEVLAMLAHGDVSSVLASCSDLLTPPLPGQVVSALAFLHFYRLIDVETAAGEPLSFVDAAWSTKQSRKTLQELAATVRGRLTPLGAVVYGVAVGAKLSPWNAVTAVMGAMVGLAEQSFALACILELISADPAAMFPVGSSDRPPAILDPLLTVQCPMGTSEHVTLLNIHKYASDPLVDGEAFAQKTGMSFAFWSKIIEKSRDKRVIEARHRLDKWLAKDNVRDHAAALTWKAALQGLDLSSTGYASEYHDALRVVYVSKMYHFTVPCGQKHQIAFNGQCTTHVSFASALQAPSSKVAASFPSGVVEYFVQQVAEGNSIQGSLFTPFTLQDVIL